MPAAAGWTGEEHRSAFADLESRNKDAVRGFASLAAYQSVLELPQAGPAQVSLRDIATIALSLSGMALMFYFPASQVLLIVLAAIYIGVRKSLHRRRAAGEFAACHSGIAPKAIGATTSYL